MKITPVSHQYNLDSIIKLAVSKKQVKADISTQQEISPPDAANPVTVDKPVTENYENQKSEIKNIVNKFNNAIITLNSNENKILKAIYPFRIQYEIDPNMVPYQVKSTVEACYKLSGLLKSANSLAKQIASMPNSTLDQISDKNSYISEIDNNIDIINSISNYLFNIEDIQISSIKILEDIDISSQEYNDYMSKIHKAMGAIYKPLLTSISALGYSVNLLKNISSLSQPKPANIPVASKKSDIVKTSSKQSFASLDPATKQMLMKYWKILYPKDYVEAQLKNY